MPVLAIEQDFKVKNGLIVANTLTVLSTVESLNTNTGAVIVSGGAAVKGSLNVFGSLTVVGNLNANLGSLTVSTATHLSGGTAGAIPYQTAVGRTAYINIGANNRVLVSNGTTATWANQLTLDSNTSATSTTTGALIVGGGVGIGGALYINTTSFIFGSQILTTATVNQYASQTAIFGGTDISVNTSTGNVTVTNSSTFQSVTSRGSSTNQAITISNITNAISTNSGALQVAGGVGVGRDVRIGGILTATAIFVGGYAVNTGTGVVSPYPDIFTITNTTNASSTITGALQVRGGLGIGGNLYVGGSFNVSGTIAGNATSADKLSSARTISLSGDVTGATSFDGSGNVNIVTTITSDAVALGIDTTGNYLAGGSVGGYGLTASGGSGEGTTFAITSNATSTDTVSTIAYRDGAGNIDVKTFKATSNTSAASTTTGALQVVGGVGIGTTLHVGGQVRVYANNASNNTLTGALVVTGGVALGGDLRVGGNNLVVGAGTGGIITGLGGLTSTIITVTATTPSVSTQTGALRVEGGVGIGGDLYARNIYQNGTLVGQGNVTNPSPVVFTITNTTSAISTTSGALQVAGGVGIGGDLYVGGAIVANRLTIQLTTITTNLIQTDDIIKTDNVTAATSVNSGALQIAGGAGIAGAAWIGTTSYIFGSQILTTATVNNFVTPGITTGTTGTFVINNNTNATSTNTGALQVTGGVGIGRDLRVGGAVTATSLFVGTFAVSTVTGILSPFSGIFTITNQTNANSTISGALQVAGGVGIGANLYLGGDLNVAGSTNATSTNTGALQVSGGVGIGRDLRVGGAVTATSLFVGTFAVSTVTGILSPFSGIFTITNTTSATSTSSGALQVAGGIGVGGAIYAQNTSFIAGAQILTSATVNSFIIQGITTGTTGTFVINNTTTSISTTTGALQVRGGVGIGQDIFVGGNITLPRGSYNHAITRSGASGEILTLGIPFYNVAVDVLNGVDINTSDGTNFWNWSFNNDGTTNFPGQTTLNSISNQENYWLGPNTNRFQQLIVINSSTQSTNTLTGALRVEGGVGIGGYISLTSGAGATGRLRWGSVHLAVRDAGDGFGSILFNSGASTYPTSTTSTSSVIIGALAAPSAGGDSNVIIGHLAGFNITTNRNNIFIGKNAGQSVNVGSSNVLIGGYTGNDAQLVMISSSSNVILSDGSGSIKAWADAAGQWIIPNTANAVSTTTGALTVRGGLGVSKDVHVGGILNVGGVVGGTITGLLGFTSTNITVSGFTNATSTNTGVLQVVGGAGVGRDLYVGGTIYSNGFALTTATGGLTSPYAGLFTMTNTTNAISTTSGAFQVAGGIGVGRDIFVGGKITVGLTSGTGAITGVGQMKIESNLNAISTDTGALQVVGGAAINRDLYVGGNLLVAGGQSTATSFVAFNIAMSVAFGY